MAPLAPYLLLLLTCICQSIPLPFSSATRATKASIAFCPRGGSSGYSKEVINTSSGAVPLSDSGEIMEYDDEEDAVTPPFDLEGVSKQLHKEEVAEIKKSQDFLLKQQRRRDLDKTWLDKGITAFIEFFENIFRWEVIEV
eukprot:27135_1